MYSANADTDTSPPEDEEVWCKGWSDEWAFLNSEEDGAIKRAMQETFAPVVADLFPLHDEQELRVLCWDRRHTGGPFV